MSRYERLTSWDNRNAYVRKCFERTAELGGCKDMDATRCVRCEHNLVTVYYLAEYEDSGLSPSQVAELLKKLTEAITGQLDSDVALGDVYGFVVGGELLSALDKLAEYESTGLSVKQFRALVEKGGLKCLQALKE